MRIILSEGQVNIFNLAKNAGTSVEQIERFYARNLPLSAEMARNLQSFGLAQHVGDGRSRTFISSPAKRGRPDGGGG